MRLLSQALLTATAFPMLVCAQTTDALTVRIYDAAPVTMTAQELKALPQRTAVLHDHGKEVTFEGVLVHDILAKAGLDFGKELHGKQLAGYVLANAADGYEVVYALAEFDPTVMDSDIIVAETQDGQPLGEKSGPLRIVAPHDKRPTRSVRMLREIDVVQLRK